jgi:hypothetical protein
LDNHSFLSRASRHFSGKKTSKKDRAIALRPIPMTGSRFHVLQGKSYAPVAVEPLTLSSWTAISGAAFGTGTGRSTSLPLGLLLGLANLRLGYWWNSGLSQHDRTGHQTQNFWRWLKRSPGKLVPMQSLLLSDFLAKFHGPSHRYWNISDGGHFDVTALYELIRRRTPFIIAMDASIDPKVTFKDHGEFVRQVRLDFDAEVTFLSDPETACKTGVPIKVPPWIVNWLKPTALGGLSVIGKENGKYAALACVRYGGETEPATWIVLLKACLIKNETLDVAAYALSNPDFPSDSTLNQFFDDEQWESYRKLGESVGEAVLA